MIDSLQEFAGNFPDWLQWAGVLLVSAIPFVESYFGSVIGVAIGLHPVVAIVVAVIGNVISMLAFVYGAGAIRDKATKNKQVEEKPKRQRLKRMFDKFGGAGSLAARPDAPALADHLVRDGRLRCESQCRGLLAGHLDHPLGRPLRSARHPGYRARAALIQRRGGSNRARGRS